MGTGQLLTAPRLLLCGSTTIDLSLDAAVILLKPRSFSAHSIVLIRYEPDR
jgi:hypothetical protein